MVIPARDEAHAIGGVVAGARISLPLARVVVVDDASRDATAARARAAGAEVVRLNRHAGYAGALRVGYATALEGAPDVVVQMDGDGQHRPADLPALLFAMPGWDLVLGSRFLGGAPGYAIPPLRRAGMAACRWMATAVGGLALSDPTSGLRALTPAVATALVDDGFPSGLTETSLLIHLHRQGMRIAEVPVRMLPPTGRSMHDGLAGGIHLLKISWAVLGLVTRTDRPAGTARPGRSPMPRG